METVIVIDRKTVLSRADVTGYRSGEKCRGQLSPSGSRRLTKGDKHRQYGNDNEHQYRLNVHTHAPNSPVGCKQISELGFVEST